MRPLRALRWRLFRLLEWLSDQRGNTTAGALQLPDSQGDAIWVFASTIGELNATAPLLQRLLQSQPLPLVLITDHEHYRAPYLARFPQASVCVSLGHSRDASALALRHPPRLLLVAEIPALPSDAPCRFSYAFVREAHRHGARVVLANGWLYHYAPPSRMDRIERALLGRDFLTDFDLLLVQDDSTRDHLLRQGARAGQLQVVGNLKFDAMQRGGWTPAQASRSPALLAALAQAGRPVLVAGCVTDTAEQRRVLDAFMQLRARHADALLILAPRHPENAASMQALADLLAGYPLPPLYRTRLDDGPLPGEAALLVLDSVGELCDFYAVASAAHVGVDHNVLEPLAFGKPVSVSGGWNDTYPSYPVYRLLQQRQVLLEADDAPALAAHWQRVLDGGEAFHAAMRRADEALQACRGALDRHWQALQPCLPR